MQDLRYGFRMLLRKPGFTTVAVLTLALGIGANTAVFSVVNAVLLEPLPYRDPDRLVTLWETDAKTGGATTRASFPDYVDWRDQSRSFERLAAWRPAEVSLTGAGAEPERLDAAIVTHDFFRTLGTEPGIGRAFRGDEDRPGGDRVVVLSDGLWRRRFGADREILGRSINVDGNSQTVIGVMPPGFRMLADAELWTLLGDDRSRTQRGMHSFRVLGRLRADVSLERAAEEITAITKQLERQYPESNAGRGALVTPLHEQMVGDVRPMLLILLGAVGFVLLIACANVANLLLARATSREKEVAVRAALGAGRLRLLRQFLTESVLLATLGGVAGLLVGYWGVRSLVALVPETVPRLEEIQIDARVLMFTLLGSLLTGVIFGLAPALHVIKPNLKEALKQGSRGASDGSGRGWIRRLLVVAETALAVVLVIGAGLLIKSFWRLQHVDPGFSARNVLTLKLELPAAKYPESEWTRTVAFYTRAVERIEALPDVDRAAVAFNHPLEEGFTTSFLVEGRTPPAPGTEPEAHFRPVTPAYFETVGLPLRKGRTFTDRDDANAPGVAIINDAMARRFFPNEDPIGRRFGIVWPPRVWKGVPGQYEIVGIAGNEKFTGLHTDAEPAMYFPHRQVPFNAMSLVIRARTDPARLASSVRGAIWSEDRELPVYEIKTIDELLADEVGEPRFTMLLLVLFASVALMLAAVGIYGVMAYAVSRRTQEIGIRMALGARARDVIAMVVGQGMALIGAGVAVGVAAALVLTRPMTSLLFGVAPTDPPTFAAMAAFLALVGFAACLIPARRAARVDPLTALRCE